jgi:hypothetical protein
MCILIIKRNNLKQSIELNEVRELLNTRLAESKKQISQIEKSLSKYVCPIYSQDDKNDVVLWGSAVLIKIADCYFLVTAAHVLLRSQTNTLFIWGNDGLVVLEGNSHSTPLELAENSKIEFSFMKLSHSLVSELKSFEFLDISNVEPNDLNHPKKLYTFVGYPCTQNKPKFYNHSIKRSIFIYTSNSLDLTVYKRLDLLASSHLVVGFEKKKGVNQQNRNTTMPDPFGMSGGGVWRLMSYSGLSLDFTPKLVGIGLEYHENGKCLVALRIAIILEAIKREFPQLDYAIPKSLQIKVGFSDE